MSGRGRRLGAMDASELGSRGLGTLNRPRIQDRDALGVPGMVSGVTENDPLELGAARSHESPAGAVGAGFGAATELDTITFGRRANGSERRTSTSSMPDVSTILAEMEARQHAQAEQLARLQRSRAASPARTTRETIDVGHTTMVRALREAEIEIEATRAA